MKPVALIADIPGYKAARQSETLIRDLAFLGSRETIYGLTVQPLTLRMYGELRLAGSAFLPPFQTPDLRDFADFIWRVSTGFNRKGGKPLKAVLKWCRQFESPRKPLIKTRQSIKRYEKRCDLAFIEFAKAVHSAREYVNEAMQDSPKGSGAGGEPDPFSDICALCARLGRQFHHFKSEAEILDLPLKKLFQYLRECRVEDYIKQRMAGLPAERPVMPSRSDEIIGQYLAELNSQNRKN